VHDDLFGDVQAVPQLLNKDGQWLKVMGVVVVFVTVLELSQNGSGKEEFGETTVDGSVGGVGLVEREQGVQRSSQGRGGTQIELGTSCGDEDAGGREGGSNKEKRGAVLMVVELKDNVRVGSKGWVHVVGWIAPGERYLDRLRLKAGELALMNKARTINQNETVTVFM